MKPNPITPIFTPVLYASDTNCHERANIERAKGWYHTEAVREGNSRSQSACQRSQCTLRACTAKAARYLAAHPGNTGKTYARTSPTLRTESRRAYESAA